MGRLLAGVLLLATLTGGAPALRAAETSAELMAVARKTDGRVIFENEFARIHNTVLEYPPASRQVAEERPVVLYVRLGSETAAAKTRLLERPVKARPSWRPGVVPVGIWVELLKVPSRYSLLGDPGTYPPRDAVEEDGWGDGKLILATFRPFDYGVGLGPDPSVAVFLSDGVVEVSTQGLRRRIAVQAGEALWFEARTRLSVLDDFTVGVAIIQVPRR